MPKGKINFTTLVVLITVVAIGGGIFAGFGGIEGIADYLGYSKTTDAPESAVPNAATPAKKRSRAIAGKPYAQLIKEGNELLAQSDSDGALEMFQEAARMSPKDSLPYEKVGDVFVIQGKYDKAADNYSFAFGLETKNRRLFLKQVRSLMNGRKIAEAQAALDKVQIKTPEIRYILALIASYYNEQQKARDEFLALTKLTNNDAEATDLTPLSLIRTNSQLITDMYNSFELAKESPLSYLQALLAKTYNQIGEYGLSIEMAFNALKLQNDYRDVWIVLGHSFLKTQRWFDAEDALTKAIALDTKHPLSYMYRGLARMKLKKVRDALADFSLALDTGYKPQIHVELQIANANYVLGNAQRALELYTKVLKTDPTTLGYFKRPIELALFSLNDMSSAQTLIAAAAQAHPKNALPLAWQGFIKVHEGNLLDARTLINEAINLDKQEPFVQLAQAELERASGRTSEAEASYKRLLDSLTTDDGVLMKQYIESVTTKSFLPSLSLD